MSRRRPAVPRGRTATSTRRATPPRSHCARDAASLPASFTANLEADDFVALCELVRQLCGVDLAQYKRNQMERRVRTWTERRGTPDLAEYGKRLRRDPDELDAFLDRVTINVSHLWRHEDQFEILRTKILPELAERRRLKIWSAGCSYGAEAYTIAAICRETIPTVPVEIVGTDLDKRMVARARDGDFTAEDARTVAESHAAAPFRAAAGRRLARQARNCKRMVRFENGDLLRMAVPTERYDVVFCRNTVIYFTEEVRDALHARLVKSLSPGGYLVVGNIRARRRPARAGANLAVPLHLPEELMDEYLPMFLAEGREHLQELNLAVVRIEETPDDPETVDEIFRIAHSLKGMSATMGFAGHGGAHARDGGRLRAAAPARAAGSSAPRSTCSSTCLDALSAAVEAIDSTGAGGDRAAGPDRAPAQPRARAHAESRRPSAPAPRRVPDNLAELADGRRVVQITAILDDDVSMPAVRAYMVLSAIAELGETLACRPVARRRRHLRRPRDRRVGRQRPHRRRARRRRRAPCPRSPRCIVFEAVSDAALDEPDEVVDGTPAGRRRRAAVDGPASAAAERPARRAGRSAAPAAPAPGEPQPKGGSSTVRVDAERLDQLMHFMGELVLHRTQVEALAARPTSRASRRPCRTSRAPRTRCSRWSCRSG